MCLLFFTHSHEHGGVVEYLVCPTDHSEPSLTYCRYSIRICPATKQPALLQIGSTDRNLEFWGRSVMCDLRGRKMVIQERTFQYGGIPNIWSYFYSFQDLGTE